MTEKKPEDPGSRKEAAPPADARQLGAAGLIHLFGQRLAGVKITEARALGGRFGGLANPIFAWIYGFSFEGHYNELARPSLFVVEGEGTDVAAGLPATGLPTELPKFSHDLFVWVVDRDDKSIRLTVDSGPYDRILLDPELRGDRLMGSYSGSNVNLQGSNRPLMGTTLRRSE